MHWGKDATIQTLKTFIREEYKLEIHDVMKQGQAILLDAVLSIPGKENEKADALASKLSEYTNSDDDISIDLEITCYKIDDESKKILDGVPPVWVFFDETSQSIGS